MPDTTYRLFFAVWPDAPAAQWLDEQAEHLHQLCGGRQVAPRQVHLTLAFVGEVGPEHLPQVEACAERALAQQHACRLRLDKLAVWSNGIGWAGPQRTPAALARLAERLQAELLASALPHEARRFKPHITLLRKATPHAALPDVAPSCLQVDHVALVASRLTRGGPIYQELRRWALPRRADGTPPQPR